MSPRQPPISAPALTALGQRLISITSSSSRCWRGAERFELIIESKEGSHLRGGPDNLVYRLPSGCGVKWACSRSPWSQGAAGRTASAGMGSSATAIVAGLMGANALAGEALGKEKLLELAIDIEGHPDNVVPSLLGGLCLTAQAASRAGAWCAVNGTRTCAVVAIPSIRLSTAGARRAMPKQIVVPDAVSNLLAHPAAAGIAQWQWRSDHRWHA